ncbi:replicative DNA helicase [Paenibacillus eucommiae]|uniref:Replicative DNA helicase n=1 Tax=Paenibacillus eucommiae TaxID=1355755 RepID=A0ABS4IY66_9BACL|nr:replicative DNA helicase [Paenibacillus eucommiae]MBP1992527.1 replicative DNA helicase [Paenibacillus eucommiae]
MIANLSDIELPADIGAEQSILGAILLDETMFEIVKEKLIGGEFFDKKNSRIFRAMSHVRNAGNPLDLVSLTGQLEDSEELAIVGGVTYLSNLANAVPTVANTGYYVERVKEMFLKREAIQIALDLLKQAAEEQDIKGFVAMAETSIAKISDKSAKAKEFVGIRDVLMEVWEDAEHRYNNRFANRGVTGIRSCYDDLDKMTAGFQDGDLIIVAARPSVGKTAFALNIAQNVSIKTGETVAIFSLEMSGSQLVQRMICAEGMIDASRMRSGYFEGDDWEKMTMAVGKLSEADIYIDDTPGITVNEIRSKCRKLKKEKGLGMILIDYLQLIQGTGRGSNRQEEVSGISRTLKQLARELEVPIIALSQLSRGVEQRQDKRPMMSDLRESGAIEQDADIVAFLYRDDYYDKESEKKNIIEIIIAKQRNGPTGTVELAFLKNYNKFVSMDRNVS